eukprot:1127395-Prymnesium_polylepis.1
MPGETNAGYCAPTRPSAPSSRTFTPASTASMIAARQRMERAGASRGGEAEVSSTSGIATTSGARGNVT